MKIFLSTARLDDIQWAADRGLLDGIVTSPALLAAEAGGDGRELLADICRLASVPVCVSVSAVNDADIYRDGRELAKLADHVQVQIPFIEDAIAAMRRLSSEGVRCSATLVFNAAQALLATKAGASTVCTPVDQLDALGQGAIDVVSGIRAVFDAHVTECDLMAQMAQNSSQFALCAAAGADIISVTPTTLRNLLLHPLTDRGLDQFLNDLSRVRTRPA